MKLIACVDNNWGIGKDNKLLFHIPEDLEFFKLVTKNNIVVMGYNTFKSLPNIGLPFRENLILTRKNLNEIKENYPLIPNDRKIKFINDINYILDLNKSNNKEVFIIGGEKIYKLFLPYCETAYITKVFDVVDNVNKFCPNLDKYKNWYINNKSDIKEFNSKLRYQFLIYKNINPTINIKK